MPRFGRIRRDFRVSLSDPGSGEEVRFYFVLTTQQQHIFTMGHDNEQNPMWDKLWPLVMASLRRWEGVEDLDGKAVEYSKRNFETYIPPLMWLTLRTYWWAAVMGFSAESGDDATRSPDSDTSESSESQPEAGTRPNETAEADEE